MHKILICLMAIFCTTFSPSAAQSPYYSRNERTAEKLEILLDELDDGIYDADIRATERAYQKLRQTNKQCRNYHKAIQKLNNKLSSEQQKRYNEASRLFSDAAKDFLSELAPLMTRMKVSEYTWKYTWGINNFCQNGSDGKHADSLFKAEQKTLKEALQDCVAAHLDKIKAAQNKSATEQDFL